MTKKTTPELMLQSWASALAERGYVEFGQWCVRRGAQPARVGAFLEIVAPAVEHALAAAFERDDHDTDGDDTEYLIDVRDDDDDDF